MANVDWLLLAAYNCKSVGMSCNQAKAFLKEVAAYSMVKAMSKETTAKLIAEWSPMKLSKFLKGTCVHCT